MSPPLYDNIEINFEFVVILNTLDYERHNSLLFACSPPVAEEYTQRHVESGAYHSECEREPLFMISISDQREGDARKNLKARPSSLSFHFKESLPVSAPRIPIKKTMAAALVESTKKESLALVPKDVANAVQRFLPFFNEALFPHKPPPMAAAARLLFTDAEDEYVFPLKSFFVLR